MKINIFINFIAITIIFIFVFLFPVTTFAVTTDSANVNLQVTGVCNNNNICEQSLGEDSQNCPNDCEIINTQSGGGIPVVFKIKNIKFDNITVNSANISWATTQFSLCQFLWGKTSEYSQEIISETTYTTSHSVQLKNLDYSNVYHFKITCVSGKQEKDQTQDQQFKTLAPVDNVINFTATPGDEKIKLSWANPPDASFYGVKILRNGAIIYEGSGTYFDDVNLVNGKTYYYAIFAEDNNKNYSSGVVASATPYKNGGVQPIIPEKPSIYLLKILIIDFNNKILNQICINSTITYLYILIILLLIIILILIILFLIKRRKNSKE